MNFIQVFILAFVQGLTELLPVSSSAHVIVAGRFLGWDATSPEGTFLLVMLHTGTMFAVLCYFWARWKQILGREFITGLAVATVCTGVVGFGLKTLIEKVFMHDVPHAEIEGLFKNLPLMATALGSAGVLILISGTRTESDKPLDTMRAAVIGIVQGLCLPFRGFSRSGATISTGILAGVSKMRAEEFSFALAVILTPPIIARELHRLMKAVEGPAEGYFSMHMLIPGFVGMLFSFAAGMLALRWLSSWIEGGRWKLFGYYCLAFAAVVLGMHFSGY